MKPLSPDRLKEIREFSESLRSAGKLLAPQAKDAERIRRLGTYLDTNPLSVKRWWYEQSCPRGGSAKAILKLLAQIDALPTQEELEIDAGDIH
jgi:hypothetical protein